jgi:hypothetical protein
MSLAIWVVYDHPRDYPDSFVARQWTLDKPTGIVIESVSLPVLREHFALRGLVCMDRAPEDDPVIVETWF